jgi:signal transduction histidine kinase/CheY-like chemotaxis protein/GAF domain-containing protein
MWFPRTWLDPAREDQAKFDILLQSGVEERMKDELILVIDDDRQALTLIERVLSRSGYAVETISDGQTALERLREAGAAEDGDLALILCDLMMPGVDGLRILERAKEHCPDAVFCLVTGYATTDSAIAALRRGVYDYLAKPLDLDDLLSTVQRALEHRALLTQNKRLIEGLRERNVMLEFLHRKERRKSEQLRRISAIAREITPILDVERLVQTVLDLIGPTFDFDAVSFGLHENGVLHFRGGQLDGQRMAARESVFWRLTDGGKHAFVRLPPGVQADEVDATGETRTAVRSNGHSPYDLIFPLNKVDVDGERTLGFWVADWADDSEFREENLPYLESLAAQTLVVLENARLYALAKRVDELAFLNEVGRAANQRLDLTETIRSLLWCVQRTFDTSVIEIALLDGSQETEQAFALIDGVFCQAERPLLGRAFAPRSGTQPLVMGGEAEAPKRIEIPPGLPRAGSLLVRSSLGALLRFRGRQIGVLGLASTRPSAFTAEEGRLIQIAGAQMATLIQNARLFQEVESARQMILQSRDTLRTLFDGILEGIYIVDRDSVILAINRTQTDWAGKSFAELVGSPAEHAFPGSQRSLELIRETFRTGEPMSCVERQRFDPVEGVEQRVQRSVHRWTEWEIHTYPIMRSETHARNGERALRLAAGNDGAQAEPLRSLSSAAGDCQQVERVVVVVRNVTEERVLEASLVQSEKMAAIGTLAAGFAHEINNPMTVIAMNAQILSEDIPARHPVYGSVELIDRASKRASRIVRNLLDFSRSEGFESVPTDVNLSLEEAVSLVETQLRKANVQIVCELEPGLPPIWASPDHLHVIWLNLLLNARDAIEEKGEEGTIQVTSHRREDRIVIRIADTGVGMSGEVLRHVYEPFFTTKGPGRGTGLGLFTCYRTLERHGGDIRVDSLEGEGTVFRISLPIHQEPVLES